MKAKKTIMQRGGSSTDLLTGKNTGAANANHVSVDDFALTDCICLFLTYADFAQVTRLGLVIIVQ